jgi:8-oxo-dGTP pyrophosphatase MutT (NUDIX family)
MVWKPRLTVAAIIEQQGRFLLVEERIDGKPMLNQPAGHVEDGESIVTAVIRETLEETAWDFRPEALVGIYRWVHPDGDTYLRAAFSGEAVTHYPDQALDPDIDRVRWMDVAELHQAEIEGRFRSPLVMRCLQDYLAGRRYPLALLQDVV